MSDLALAYTNQDYSTGTFGYGSPELNRILSAAIVSPRFRTSLLNDPESAISRGYQGESFNLSREERDCLLSIKAKDLASFANQMLCYKTRTNRYEKPPVLPDSVVQYLER